MVIFIILSPFVTEFDRYLSSNLFLSILKGWMNFESKTL